MTAVQERDTWQDWLTRWNANANKGKEWELCGLLHDGHEFFTEKGAPFRPLNHEAVSFYLYVADEKTALSEKLRSKAKSVLARRFFRLPIAWWEWPYLWDVVGISAQSKPREEFQKRLWSYVCTGGIGINNYRYHDSQIVYQSKPDPDDLVVSRFLDILFQVVYLWGSGKLKDHHAMGFDASAIDCSRQEMVLKEIFIRAPWKLLGYKIDSCYLSWFAEMIGEDRALIMDREDTRLESFMPDQLERNGRGAGKGDQPIWLPTQEEVLHILRARHLWT